MPIYEVEAPDGRILEIEGNKPPSEKELDDIFATVGNKQQPSQPEYKKMSFKEVFRATPEELNENIKALGRQRLQQRQEWEQSHPVISEIQKAFQPNYRADLIDMQNQAEYGMQVPLGQRIKSDFQKAGQNLVPSVNIATTLYTGKPIIMGKGLPAIGNAMLQGARQGAIQGGVEGLTGGIADEGLSVNALNRGLQGVKLGASVGGLVPPATKLADFGWDITKRVGKGLVQGGHEAVGISKNAIDRMKVSPRGASLSENNDIIGSAEFITDVAERFNNGVQQLKNQEINAFAKARDNLIAQNKDVTVDVTPYTQKAFDKINALGFLDENGFTPAGNNAENLNKFLNALDYYNGKNLDISDLQSLKTDVLDPIINYKAPPNQYLGKPTESLQKIAKEMRKDINDVLNEKLGTEYGAINKKLSEVLDITDKNPELKDLTNSKSLFNLATKLKKVGTTRVSTARELKKLEKIMNDNGIKISDYSILDDILDHNTAKEISRKVETGLAGGLANIVRRSAAQPIIEKMIGWQDTINPMINTLQGVGRKVRPVGKVLQSPALYSGLGEPILYGGVVYNKDRY